MRPPPRLVLQAGLYRSASTWATNVIASILRRSGPAPIHYIDSGMSLASAVADDPRAVIKMHVPDTDMRFIAHLAGLPIVVSIRDPLDCVASLMERFFFSFESGAAVVAQSAAAMVTLQEMGDPLVLRYEEQRRDAATIALIASHIGARLDDGEAEGLAEQLSPHAVSSLIEGLVSTGYFGSEPNVAQYHGETHWHPRHIGSGAIARYRSILDAGQIAAIDRDTQAFCRKFGYERDIG